MGYYSSKLRSDKLVKFNGSVWGDKSGLTSMRDQALVHALK